MNLTASYVGDRVLSEDEVRRLVAEVFHIRHSQGEREISHNGKAQSDGTTRLAYPWSCVYGIDTTIVSILDDSFNHSRLHLMCFFFFLATQILAL